MSIEPKGYYIGIFHNDNHKYQGDVVKITGEKEIFELDEDHEDFVWRMGDKDGWDFDDFKEVKHYSDYILYEADILEIPNQELIVGQYYWGFGFSREWEPVLCFQDNDKKKFKRLGHTIVYSAPPKVEIGGGLKGNQLIELGLIISLGLH